MKGLSKTMTLPDLHFYSGCCVEAEGGVEEFEFKKVNQQVARREIMAVWTSGMD